MPETPMAELGYKRNIKTDLLPTIWCPGCGIGSIMMQLAMVLDEMGLDETNTLIVTGIGCTGRMGSYLNYESVYTLHGRTLPVAEAIKTVRPEMNVIVVAGDGDTASIGGNHLLHSIRRNAHVTVLCNNNEIYGLTGGQTGPTTPTGTKTLSSPAGNPNTPVNLQAIVRSSPHSLYAKTTVYHQLHMRNAIREAIEHDGFSLVDITSQCIENNGRRIGFASANEMLNFYRKTYKRAPKDADHLEPFQLGVLYPLKTDANGASSNGNGHAPAELPRQPAAPLASATDSPGEGGATEPPSGTEDRDARRAESQRRAALMAQLPSELKLRVAKRELSLEDALESLRTGASAPVAPEPRSVVEVSATGADPLTEVKTDQLAAQKGEAAAERRDPIGGEPGTDVQPAVPRTPADAAPAIVASDPKEARRAEAQRKLALMQQLPSDVKLRVAKREISLEDALREAGVDPEASV
jgi:2-oxoglutarate ferredoxin oxidoreductase subunit beta